MKTSVFTFLISFFLNICAIAQTTNSNPLKVEIIPYAIDCITPPEGFMEREGFNGYMHFGTRSSIVIFKLTNRTIIDAEEAMNESYFESNNITSRGK